MKTLPTLKQALAVRGVQEVRFDGLVWTAYEAGDLIPASPLQQATQQTTVAQARELLAAAIGVTPAALDALLGSAKAV